MIRLFAAIAIPEELGTTLLPRQDRLPGARWRPLEALHITLRFIGDVDGRTADEIVDQLDRIERPEFQLQLTGMGAFGGKKPHAIYAGVSNPPELYALQAEIERICKRLRLPADPRKFTPHVTLARLRNSRVEDVVRYLSGRGGFHTNIFTVSRFVLLSSRDSIGGGPYLTEEVFPLQEPRFSGIADSVIHPL